MSDSATINTVTLDGRELAKKTRRDVRARAEDLAKGGRSVALDAVLVTAGDTPARQYADRQAKSCVDLGIEYRLHELPHNADLDAIAGLVLRLGSKDSVHAIMVHLPLPDGVDAYEVQRLITPAKDVEGVNPANIGNIVYGRSSLAPCTALAAVAMIESTGIELVGKRCVVVGAGDVVGKPIAVLMMRREATVISCNKHTWGLEDLCRSADVLVAAAGVPHLIGPGHIKPGAVVLDVGVNRVTGADGVTRTLGDVDFDAVQGIAGAVSPVPGGVGPMTVATLLSNVVTAAEARASL